LAAKRRFAFYRKRAGWTQATLAEQARDRARLPVGNRGRRKSGDVKTLRKLADLLKISLDRSRRARSVKPETAIEEGRRPVIALYWDAVSCLTRSEVSNFARQRS